MDRSDNHHTNWRAVYDELLPRVYNYFRYRVGDEMWVEDLTAMTFERAWQHRENYRSDLSAFSTWVLAIARNLAIDHWRKHRPALPLEAVRVTTSERSVEETVQHDDDLRRLNALLSQLKEQEREIVALKYGAAMTNRAIANLTGLSESNVGTILYRVLQRLRVAWEERIYDE